MSAPLPRLILCTVIASLLLAGCAAHHPIPTPTPTARTATATRTTTTTPSTSTKEHQHRSGATTAATAATATTATSNKVAADSGLPEQTGIPACDDYLSSYLACHRAAAIYAPDQLQGRYQAMRTSLLRDSKDADIRPQLAARCNSLATQLRQALHGKSCAENAAPASPSS